MTYRLKGTAKAAIVASTLTVSDGRGVANENSGEVAVENFRDDFFMVQADVSAGITTDIWVRYQDPNNGYRLRISSYMTLHKIVNGAATLLETTGAGDGWSAIKIKIYNDNGSHRFKVWGDGTLEINVTDSTFLAGGVAFGGSGATFDNCRIGYDNNNDDDINDPTDDIVWSDDFGGTSRTPAYDHAGNMIDP